MKCCICGPVRNCGPFLDKVFNNIEKIGALFDEYQIILYYDISTDDTLDKLQKYKQQNPRVTLYVGTTLVSPYRTHRLAHARNFCLQYIKQNYNIDEYPYFIMMDFDDVNCKNVNPDVLNSYLLRNDWDGLSFNTRPAYYDIWALSIYPYCFSYNHFKNTPIHNYHSIQDYITNKLNKLNKGQLIRCISAFNGFSIYRRNKFLNTNYDGSVRLDLMPISHIKAHSIASKSTIVFPDFGHIKADKEDCEHRAFHVQAINNDNARIMISPKVLFY